MIGADAEGARASFEKLLLTTPESAARRIGLSTVPLLGAREMDRPGALPRVIRLLVHCYADPERPPQHVYLRDAVQLRQDLQGAQ